MRPPGALRAQSVANLHFDVHYIKFNAFATEGGENARRKLS